MLEAALAALAEGRHGEPFALLGPHAGLVWLLLPGAQAVTLLGADGARLAEATHEGAGLFQARLAPGQPYRLRIIWPGDVAQETEDPYAFGPLLSDFDLHLLAEGRHRDLAACLGAVPMRQEGVDGVRFAVWAPNARRVSVVGDFNSWDGRRHAMRRRQAGVWEIFIPRLGPGALYKYEILGPHGLLPLKADPLARRSEGPAGHRLHRRRPAAGGAKAGRGGFRHAALHL